MARVESWIEIAEGCVEGVVVVVDMESDILLFSAWCRKVSAVVWR